jgi:hypothetical protein
MIGQVGLPNDLTDHLVLVRRRNMGHGVPSSGTIELANLMVPMSSTNMIGSRNTPAPITDTTPPQPHQRELSAERL